MLREMTGNAPAAEESEINTVLFERCLKANLVSLRHMRAKVYSSLIIDKQASISTCSQICLEAGNSCRPACPQGLTMQLSALNLAAGVGDGELLTNRIMLHDQMKHGLADMTNFGHPNQMKML